MFSKYDFIELGSTPSGEDCVQVNDRENYIPAMRKECERYKTMLEAKFPIPDNVTAHFKIKNNPHDFGDYLEVAIVYYCEDEKSNQFALFIDSNIPEYWTETEVPEFKYIEEESEV